MTDTISKVKNYQGKNSFVIKMKDTIQKYGKLTEKQSSVVEDILKKESEKSKVLNMCLPTVGETLKIGRKTGQDIKKQYGLKFNPILIDMTKVLAVSPKAVKFAGKMTVKRGNVCMSCGMTLTDEFSQLTGMGKTCAKHFGIEYIKDVSEATRFREEYLKRIEEIGEFEFWIPKSQIKVWNGKTAVILKMLHVK